MLAYIYVISLQLLGCLPLCDQLTAAGVRLWFCEGLTAWAQWSGRSRWRTPGGEAETKEKLILVRLKNMCPVVNHVQISWEILLSHWTVSDTLRVLKQARPGNDASGPCLSVYWSCDINGETDGRTRWLVDHLFQYRISPWPKTAEKRGFCTCVTDIRTDGRKDGRTDGQTLL